MAKSKIEWTGDTWNPITGCSKVSPGCLNCYAEKLHKRLQAMGCKKYQTDFNKIICHEDTLEIPGKQKKPAVYFVNSMSDLFHPDVEPNFVYKVFQVMNDCDNHIFQILTKRPERIGIFNLTWTHNIWMGVSVENSDYLDRIFYLIASGAKHRFVSFEPLLGEIKLFKDYFLFLDWVIVGGESGAGARPMKEEWVINIRDACKKANVPFFFKQWGGVNKKKSGRLLQGIEYLQFPQGLKKE